MKKKIQKDSDDFLLRKFTLKVQNWHFLMNCHQMETQNLVISFDYKTLLFRTHTAFYAKSKYSLTNKQAGQRLQFGFKTLDISWTILLLNF